jgi:plastocyanin
MFLKLLNNYKNVFVFLMASIMVTSTIVYTNAIYLPVVNAQTPGVTFPPPLFGTIRSQPAFEVNIPYSAQNATTFSPMHISIPTGMTVIWFNNDDNPHTIATYSNSSYSPPQSFNSGPILGNGGTFVHNFNQPGKYLYGDPQSNSSRFAEVDVGASPIQGSNMNMIVGGINSMPFDPAKSKSVVLSFVPTTVSIPPATSITYNVAVLNSDKKVIFSKNFDDTDGILDIDLQPTHKNVTEFTNWGPDYIGQEKFQTTGVYHIQGPVLVANAPYYIHVSLTSKDDQVFDNPPSDIFQLSPIQLGNTSSSNSQPSK